MYRKMYRYRYRGKTVQKKVTLPNPAADYKSYVWTFYRRMSYVLIDSG